MNRTLRFLALSILILIPKPAQSVSFHKKKKDFGVVPPNSVTLEAGILIGATAEDLIETVSLRTSQIMPGSSDSFEDFDDGLTFRIGYRRQTRPKVIVSLDLTYTNLSTTSLVEGVNLTARRVISEKEIAADIFSLSGTVLYSFQTLEESSFRVYVGGGFGFYVADQTLTDQRTFPDSLVAPGVPDSQSFEDSQTETALGLIGIAGGEYFFNTSYSFVVKAQGQLVETGFTTPVIDDKGNVLRGKNVMDYSGVVLSIGLSRHF